MQRLQPVKILLVEDNPADVKLLELVLTDLKIHVDLSHVADGEKAISYLMKEGEYTQVELPDIILLDLNIPKLDGSEVLKFVKEHNSLKQIPVVIMTSSDAEADIIRSYHLHANSYITKPLDLDQFFKIVNTISDFWFSIVKLPKGNSISNR